MNFLGTKYIRNFSIIAHIDHGKSTLSKKIVNICNSIISSNKFNLIDSMQLEQKHGVTIKARSINMSYKSERNGKIYSINLIDTPGHVDFSDEVSRFLLASDGVLLLVDLSKGIEAQTIANYRIASEMNLKIIPVLNKIDLYSLNYLKVKRDIKNIFNKECEKIFCCSGKTGDGVKELVEGIIRLVPYPSGSLQDLFKALIIDSWFDRYLGVVFLVIVKNGAISIGEKIKLISSNKCYEVIEIGIFSPFKSVKRRKLFCGEVGWIACGIKNIKSSSLFGDILVSLDNDLSKGVNLNIFRKSQKQVYASLFPLNNKDYESFKRSIIKLSLNDSSLYYEPEVSVFFGSGFKCGFLGSFHMKIVQERLEEECKIRIINTFPTVKYQIKLLNGNLIFVNNPLEIPSLKEILNFREPIVKCNILLQKSYLGKIISLCIKKRGVQKELIYHAEDKIELIFEIPLSEIIVNFFDQLKSISKGYASFSYEFLEYRISDIVRVEILVNSRKIDALSVLIHRKNAIIYAKEIISKIKNRVSRKLFDIVIQASIFNKIISRVVVKQKKKNVLFRCSGGDISRKKKLLKNQKKGKKKIKEKSNYLISREVFSDLFNK